MSFSSTVKEEVSIKHIGAGAARHCALAELCGFTLFGARTGEATLSLHYASDSPAIAERIRFLLNKTFQIVPEIRCSYPSGNWADGYYEVIVKNPDVVENIFRAMKLEIGELPLPDMDVPAPRLLISSDCCRRSFS